MGKVARTARGVAAAMAGAKYPQPMTDRDYLRKLIVELAVVHGRVILSSGREADYYIDLRRVTLHHAAAPLVGRVLLDLTADWDYRAVGGLTLGADPVAGAMLHVAAAQGRDLDAFVVRKADKTHGLQRRIEGPDVAGRRVLAVEDPSTTGGTVLTAGGAYFPRWGAWGRRGPASSAWRLSSIVARGTPLGPQGWSTDPPIR